MVFNQNSKNKNINNSDTTIKDVLANKIKKEHLTNYLKHSYRIYK
jgi:hypothetical protein